ncbi:MAG: acyltransferase [Paludibacteraceae bacterium]|nr:acyltransferase [Paludibacteraceae bacterium]
MASQEEKYSENMQRNRPVDILRMIAILLVVMRHTAATPGAAWLSHLFPVYSYHLALFLFVSGYLFRDMEWSGFGRFVWKKTRNLLLPFLGWNIVYAGIVTLINLRHPVDYLPPTSQVWTFHALLVEPFISGHQYILNLATWFIGMFYLALLVYGLLYMFARHIPDWAVLILYALVALAGLYSASLPLTGRGWMVVQRIAYTLFFLQLGRCFRLYIEPRLSWGNIGWFMLFILALWAPVMINGDHMYVLAFMNYDGHVLRPLLAGMFGCLFWMLASMVIARYVRSSKVEQLVSRNTWAIMTHHLLVRFILCWTFVHFYGDEVARGAFRADFWFFPVQFDYWCAIFTEIAIPVLWQLCFDKAKNRLSRFHIFPPYP